MDGYNYSQHDDANSRHAMATTRQVLRQALLLTVVAAALVVALAIGLRTVGLAPVVPNEFSTIQGFE